MLTTQGWAESVIADMAAGFPVDRWESSIDNYDYEEDSDMEDMEDPMEDERVPVDGGTGDDGILAMNEDNELPDGIVLVRLTPP